MHLVAVQHRLVVLKRGHQRSKALDCVASVLDQDISQVRRLHLLLFHAGMPSHRGALILLSAGKLNDVEASLEVVFAEITRRLKLKGVALLGEGMCP